MASPFKQFNTNKELEASGVWLNFGGYEIKIARAGGGNKRHQPAAELHFREHRQAAAVGVLPEEVAERALHQVYADAIVLGWRTKQEDGSYVPTIEGPEGGPWEFTRDNVLKLFEAIPDLFKVIRGFAENYTTFQRVQRELEGKN